MNHAAGSKTWQCVRLSDVPAREPWGDPQSWRDYSDDALIGTGWHSLGRHLGITSFGVNANEAPAGHELVVGHDEADIGGQEELYIVVQGRARFECDGTTMDVGPGDVVFAPAAVRRRAVALETPTVVVAVGGVPGRPYTPPEVQPHQAP